MSATDNILLFGELQEKRLSAITKELLTAGRKLADEAKWQLGILFVGNELSEDAFDEPIAYGADTIYVLNHPALSEYHPEVYLYALEKTCRNLQPDILLLGQTAVGRDLAPRLAFRLRTRLVTDCVDFSLDNHSLVCVKPVYGGKAYASFVSSARPQIATVRAKSFPTDSFVASRKGDVVHLSLSFDSLKIKIEVVSRVIDKSAGKNLETASVIVCGGRGIGSAQNFTLLEELAALLDGAVAASRPPCDLGWVSSDFQVGMTGEIVTPALYIAVGISGSSAHLAGCSNAKNIIAINKDPEANIFRVANYGIVADYKQVLPVVIEACKKSKTQKY